MWLSSTIVVLVGVASIVARADCNPEPGETIVMVATQGEAGRTDDPFAQFGHCRLERYYSQAKYNGFSFTLTLSCVVADSWSRIRYELIPQAQ